MVRRRVKGKEVEIEEEEGVSRLERRVGRRGRSVDRTRRGGSRRK